MLLFPDCILVLKNNVFGAVRYEDLRIGTRDQRMIVDSAPADAKTVGETWKYVNKNGSPDRRFKDNRLLPICLFEEIAIISVDGFKALMQVSKRGTAEPLRLALQAMQPMSQELSDAPLLFLKIE
ncbi:hypothetical protein [Roseovarius nanhaiticus]|uniref:hypothetical protein n=1 Tax=Roseovarius nanhaiticus TaxID=573024 RepID=UPI002492E289|nr:hypothetical protein [Roseovarius nanhaiticus]